MPGITRRQINAAIALSLTGVLRIDGASAAAPADDPARAQLNALLREISKTEQSIANITVEASAVEEHLIADHWVAQPITVALLARYDRIPGGKVRIDVRDEVLKWIEGDGPYSQSSYSVAYNGKSSTLLHISGGPLGRTGPDTTALITPGRAPILAGHLQFASGARYHLSHWHPHIGGGLEVGCRSLSGYIKEYLAEWERADGTKVQIEQDKREGVDAIRLSIRNRFNLEITWWLDPKRGHNLIGHRQAQYDKQGVMRAVNEEDQVVMLEKVVDRGDEKLWYPTEVYHYFPSDPGETRRRFHYKATRVVLNDPAFNDAVFDIVIPPGHFVDDRINNRRYQIPQPKGPPPVP